MRGQKGDNQYGKHGRPYRHEPTLLAYLRFVELNRTPETATVYKAKLRPLLRAWEALSPQEWTNVRFEEYLAAAKQGKAPGQLRPLSVRSQQMLIQAVKLFGEWCITHGVPCPEFWRGIKKPRSIRKETACLTMEQARRIMEVSHGERIELAIGLAVGCGLRRGEVERARWSDWRESDNTLLVRREKTGLHHRVPVPAFLQEVLKRHASYVGSPTLQYREPDGHMVGKMRNLSLVLKNASQTAGVPRTHFHGFRHTWASELIGRGAPPSVVQRLGGWNSLTVLARYSHALGDSMKDAVNLLE